MAPVLQALVQIGLDIRLGLFLLRNMSFVVSCDLSDVGNVILVVFGRIFFGGFLEELDDYILMTYLAYLIIHDMGHWIMT